VNLNKTYNNSLRNIYTQEQVRQMRDIYSGCTIDYRRHIYNCIDREPPIMYRHGQIFLKLL